MELWGSVPPSRPNVLIFDRTKMATSLILNLRLRTVGDVYTCVRHNLNSNSIGKNTIFFVVLNNWPAYLKCLRKFEKGARWFTCLQFAVVSKTHRSLIHYLSITNEAFIVLYFESVLKYNNKAQKQWKTTQYFLALLALSCAFHGCASCYVTFLG